VRPAREAGCDQNGDAETQPGRSCAVGFPCPVLIAGSRLRRPPDRTLINESWWHFPAPVSSNIAFVSFAAS
jgi:hypothetical protein